MLFLLKYMPHLITGAAVFSAIFTHYFIKKPFWQPCFIAAFISTGIAYVLVRTLPVNVELSNISQSTLALKTSYFAFGSSFVIAILIGYLMKLMPKILK